MDDVVCECVYGCVWMCVDVFVMVVLCVCKVPYTCVFHVHVCFMCMCVSCTTLQYVLCVCVCPFSHLSFPPSFPLPSSFHHHFHTQARYKDVTTRGPAEEVLVDHEGSQIVLTRRDVRCMAAGQWLNDEVVNTFLGLLQERDTRRRTEVCLCVFV